MTIETEYTDDDVLRAHNAEIAPPPAPTWYSKSVMTAFRRAKKASAANDARSCRIAGSLNRERMGKHEYTPCSGTIEHIQSSIMDF